MKSTWNWNMIDNFIKSQTFLYSATFILTIILTGLLWQISRWLVGRNINVNSNKNYYKKNRNKIREKQNDNINGNNDNNVDDDGGEYLDSKDGFIKKFDIEFLNSRNKEIEDDLDLLADPNGISHIPSKVKRTQQRVATETIAKGLTPEQLAEERELQRQQLEAIFKLMETDENKFGLETVDEMKDQVKLYM